MQSFIKPKRNGISANILRSECIQLRGGIGGDKGCAGEMLYKDMKY